MAYFLDPTLAQLVRDEQRGSSRPTTTTRPASSSAGPAGGGRRNKFPAPCVKCGKRVGAGDGSLDKLGSNWVTAHLPSCP